MDNNNQEEYTFFNPGFVRINKRVNEEVSNIRTDTEKWEWMDLGSRQSIDWRNFNFNSRFIEIAKGFVFHRLSTVSLSTVYKCNDLFNFFVENNFEKQFPWNKEIIIQIISNLSKKRELLISFRTFYNWGLKAQIFGFTSEFYLLINEVKGPEFKPYKNAFLNPVYFTTSDESIILKFIYESYNPDSYSDLVDNIILHLSFELAPRPSQLYCIEIDDFEKTTSKNGESYFCVKLPMTKKLKSMSLEKRERKISTVLGSKIEILISLNNRLLNGFDRGLFKNLKTGKRLASSEISSSVIRQCNSLELSRKIDPTLFRHHLAQSLADQGASAETISEILGHNSTLPARAYIASTPNIAVIKSKALGSNETYKELNSMLLTGEIIDRRKAAKERWVKGMVGSQYIGGIGSCGLTENTACPKNPVYSCYTCNKFHPFIDGSHENVKDGLMKQAQYFVDIAEKGLDLEHNRPVVQLERTIEAVDNVLQIISKSI